jgi:L-seryl-tRNA(Ser) seleniumtransferase
LKRDHAADHREWLRRVDLIRARVAEVQGVSAELWIPPIASHLPHVKVHWDQAVVRKTVKEAIEDLRREDPPIEVNPDSKDELILAVWTLLPGEEKVVGNRVRGILARAAK